MWFRSRLDAPLTRSGRPAQRIRPQLEILEDRSLLSTYTVNALTDTGAGSGQSGDLRYCITHATSGNDTITFSVTGTIKLESSLPALNVSVGIQGPGASQLTVERDPTLRSYFPVFTVGSAASVQISGLTLSYGNEGIADYGSATISNSTISNNSDSGILIYNSGSATVSNSTISNNYYEGIYNNSWAYVLSVSNSTFSSDGIGIGIDPSGSATVSNSTFSSDGNGIYNAGSATVSNSTLTLCGDSNRDFIPSNEAGAIYNYGNLTVNNSTIFSNTVYGTAAGHTSTSNGGGGDYPPGNGLGGGIYMGGGTLTINSSTLANNQAIGGSQNFTYFPPGDGYGGGLYIAGGTVTIDNSTLAGNQTSGSTGYGGGIYNAVGPGALQMYDTILANNTADVGPDLNGSVTSLGHNLIGNSTGGSGFVSSDLLNVNPQLGPLQNNGGPTQTMALLAGSPAIDAGDNTNAPSYDQRGSGFARIVNGTIDIGAFEVQNGGSTQPSSLGVSGFPTTTTAGNAGSFTVTALNAEGSTDTGYTGTVHFTSSDAQAVLPADYTFTTADQGVHTFRATLKTAGTQSITATDTATGSVTGSDTGISVNPATANRLAFAQQPSTTTAGQSISPAVTVNVVDPYGNLVTTDSSTVTVTLSSGTFAGGSATATATASGGVAAFGTLTIDKAGSYTLKATDGSLTSATSARFTVNAAAASSLSVSGFPSPTTAGVAHTFKVTLKDAYGNLATGYTGTVHFTSSDRKATLPANYTFTATDKGVHTFSATLKTAGTQSLTATDTVTTSLTSTQSGITVNAAAAKKFVLTAPASINSGAPFSLTVTVEDAYGNIIVSYVGTVHFSSTDSTATLPANYTFTAGDGGVHTFTGLILRKRGNQRITATDTQHSSLTGSAIVDVL